jgi:hypothetical protein
MITGELVGFLQSGVSVLVGTRDRELVPEASRALGARVEPGGTEISIFLPIATSARTIANLHDNGRIAVCFSRAFDHRSVQLKGRIVAITPANGEDKEVIDVYRGAIAQAWGQLGLPPRITMRMAHWPAHAVRFAVESTFVQTPGPGAGERLGTHGVGA